MHSVRGSVTALSELFKSTMTDFQRDLQRSSPTASTTSLAAEFSAFKNFIGIALNTLQRQVDFLCIEMDRQVMKRRRKMLLFHGVPEETSEDTSAKITSLVADHLNLANFASSSIKTSYRLGPNSNKKPRPLVVKFSDASVRDRVWFAKTKLKGTGITQSEFLTKTRHQVFLEARQRFGVKNCWTRDGCIHILTSDGQHHRAECLMDLDDVPSQDLDDVPNQCSQKSPVQAKSATTKAADQRATTTRPKRVVKK